MVAKPLADKCVEAVESGRTTFTSEEWKKVFFHWMTNIKDWCISRQLWWGHQIPAWFCKDCDHVTVALEDPTACAGCGGTRLVQDEDVLDTWFSSGLWPFSTLGWPDQTPALKTFYPNAVMETGFDILFFWVARMMMLGIYCMGDVPFRTVYMHPMVRDEKGQKMSKTKNNVIDPLDLTKDVGADALRFTLAALTTQGHDLNFSPSRLEGYRAFGNKIWNATRFVFMQLEEGQTIAPLDEADKAALSVADRWILHRLDQAVADVTGALERFDFAAAANAVYQFTWSNYCDWYIELCKPAFREGGTGAEVAKKVLLHVLDKSLRLLHPFMPFLTEELWSRLPIARDAESLVVAPWPVADGVFRDEAAAALLDQQIAVINAVRAIRGENRIPPKTPLTLFVSAPDAATAALVEAAAGGLALLANVATVEAGVGLERPAKSAVAMAGPCTVFVPLEGVIDLGEEASRLEKAIGKLDKDIEKIAKKLEDERFVANAPSEVVQEQRERLAEARAARATYVDNLAQLR